MKRFFVLLIIVFTALPAAAQSIDGYVEETDASLTFTSAYTPLSDVRYSGNGTRLLTGAADTGITFTFSGNTLLIYRTICPACTGEFTLCVDGQCSPHSLPNTDSDTHYIVPVAYYSAGCQEKSGYIKKLDGNPFEFDALLVLVDPECAPAGPTPTPLGSGVYLLTTPDPVRQFADVNGQTVAFDYRITAGEVMVALTLLALVVVTLINVLFRRIHGS